MGQDQVRQNPNFARFFYGQLPFHGMVGSRYQRMIVVTKNIPGIVVKKNPWDCGHKNFSDHILLVALDVFPWSELEASLLWCNLKCIYFNLKMQLAEMFGILKSISQPRKRLIRAP